MGELAPSRREVVPVVPEEESFEAIPNLERVLEHLLKYAEEHDLDIEIDDVRDLLGEDDNDFLSNLATIAAMYDIEYMDLLIELGVSLEGPVIDAPNYLEITDGTE